MNLPIIIGCTIILVFSVSLGFTHKRSKPLSLHSTDELLRELCKRETPFVLLTLQDKDKPKVVYDRNNLSPVLAMGMLKEACSMAKTDIEKDPNGKDILKKYSFVD